MASCMLGRPKSVTNRPKRDNSRRERFRAPWTARRPAHTLRRARTAPCTPCCVPKSHGRSRALRDHRAQVHGKLRTLSRCRVSRSSSRVAHRSCSQRAALVAATPSAASAAMDSIFSCVSNICAAAEDVVTHRWVTVRHDPSFGAAQKALDSSRPTYLRLL